MAHEESPGNPYIAGRALGKPHDLFFGREEIFSWIYDELIRSEQKAVVLFGQRRIGKSSILLQLQPRLTMQRVDSVYLDLTGYARQPMGHVLYECATRIVQQLRVGMEVGVEDDYDDKGYHFQRRFLSTLYDMIGAGRRIVLLFDEFDTFNTPIQDNLPYTAAARHICSYLRQLMAEESPLSFVFVIGRKPAELVYDVQATFGKAPFKRVSVLDERSARRLITTAQQQGTLRFDPEAIDRILALTSAHPFFMQLICQCLWNDADINRSKDIPMIDIRTVEAIVPQVLEASENVLVSMWNDLSSAERLICSVIATFAHEKLFMSREDLEQALYESHVRIIVRELETAAEALVETELLRYTSAGYSVFVELVRRWIAQYKPSHELQDDVGPMMPVIKRLYELGESLYNEGDLDGARAQVEQALRRDPNYTLARVLLGQVLLAQGNYDEAVRVLEEAYRYDAGRARYSLIQARLEWGAQLERREEYDMALTVYNAIIAVFPHEQVAQERHAGLHKLTILYERAIAAFNQKNWDRALIDFEQLVTEAPGFRDAKARLEEGRRRKEEDRQRTEELDTLYNRAQRYWNNLKLREALQLLRRIQDMEPNYRDVLRLIEEVEEDWEQMSTSKKPSFFKKCSVFALICSPIIFLIIFFALNYAKKLSIPLKESLPPREESLPPREESLPPREESLPPREENSNILNRRTSFRIVPSSDVSRFVRVGEHDLERPENYEYTQHIYKTQILHGEKVIIDHATRLMWQQSGSEDSVKWKHAPDVIHTLNEQSYAGHNDWRLPTIEELASLLEPTKKNGDLYIDPSFDTHQRWCWSADRSSEYTAWRVKFHTGTASELFIDGDAYVRAVRFHRTR